MQNGDTNMSNGHEATNGDKTSGSVVDFGRFLHGSESERKEAALAIDRAFQADGWVYLANHGVDQKRVNECFAQAKRFFDLPYDDKMKAPHPPGHDHHRGYSGLGRELVAGLKMMGDLESQAKEREKAPDIKESFEIGNKTDINQPNIWPPEDLVPGWRPFMETWFDDCARLIHQILHSLGVALALDNPHDISTKHSTTLFQARLLYYPPVPTALLRDGTRTRITAHSDFGTITLLFQDAVGGLEVHDAAGAFVAVPPRPDLVLVNVGDLLERWSNGRWKTCVHRVALPAEAGADDEITAARYSLPFFAAPNMDAVIEALPGCFGEGVPKKWGAITAWDYIMMRMEALYGGGSS